MDVQGLQCLVTGAASGIGEEVARLLVAGGASVTSLDRNEPKVDVKNHVSIDLSDPASIDRAVGEVDGDWDVLCNVAGIPGTHEDTKVFRINFLGLRHLTESVVPRMNNGGSVVNVASAAGFGWPQRLQAINQLLATETFDEGLTWFKENAPTDSAYNFSKEAAIVYTMGSGIRLRARGIRINAVLPGPVDTPILVDFERSMGKETVDGVKGLLGRHATPADIAPALLFFASRASAWITGTTLVTDGGLMGAVASGAIPPPDI